MIGFTAVCPKEEIEIITAFLENMPDEELTALTIGYVMENDRVASLHPAVFIVLAAVLLALLVLFFVFLKKYSVLRKAVRYGEMYDAKTGIYNRRYFSHLIDKKIATEAKAIYYLAHISLDPERMKKYYGKEQAEQLALYIAQTLQSTVGKNEYCACTFFCLFDEMCKNGNSRRKIGSTSWEDERRKWCFE